MTGQTVSKSMPYLRLYAQPPAAIFRPLAGRWRGSAAIFPLKQLSPTPLHCPLYFTRKKYPLYFTLDYLTSATYGSAHSYLDTLA